MNMQNVTPRTPTSQAPPELTITNKRLLLSAHFEFLLFKRLRRGLPVEESELLALLPFTVPNGWQPPTDDGSEPDERDQHWRQLLESARAIG